MSNGDGVDNLGYVDKYGKTLPESDRMVPGISLVLEVLTAVNPETRSG